MAWQFDEIFHNSLIIRGGSGLGPSPSPPEPDRFFELFGVFEPEVFGSGLARLGPSPILKPAGTRGYPKVTFYRVDFCRRYHFTHIF